MNDLQTSITNISEADLNALFGDEPIKNIDENNVLLGKSNVQILKDDKENVLKVGQNASTIPTVDLDNLESLNQKPDEAKKPEDEKKVEIKAEDKKEDKKDDKKKEETPSADLEVLRNTAKYYIEKGFWKDFDGRDEVIATLDEEGYAELATKQYEEMKKEIQEETVNSTGDYGKAIIEYVQNGGNPDEVIDIFKEQKVVEAISIDTEDGQKQLIEKYYVDIVGWSSEKTKKYINTLISSDELESESKEVETKYTEFFQEELKLKQLEQQAAKKTLLDGQKAFAQTINTKLAERKDFTDKDKKLIQDAVFKYDAVLPDGTKVNKFYQTFAEKQKNPDEFLDFVLFTMDKEAYNKKVKSKEENKTVDKKWSFIKSNAAVTKTTGSTHDEQQDNTKPKTTNLNWSSVLNK